MKYKLLFLLGIFSFIINAHAQTEEDLQRKYFTARNPLNLKIAEIESEAADGQISDVSVSFGSRSNSTEVRKVVKNQFPEDDIQTFINHRYWLSAGLCFNHMFYTSKYGVNNSIKSPVIATLGLNYLITNRINSPIISINIESGLFVKNYQIADNLTGKSIFYGYGLNSQFHYPITKNHKNTAIMFGAVLGASKNISKSTVNFENKYYKHESLNMNSAFSFLLRKYLKKGKSINIQYCFKLSPLFIKNRTVFIGPPYTISVSYQL